MGSGSRRESLDLMRIVLSVRVELSETEQKVTYRVARSPGAWEEVVMMKGLSLKSRKGSGGWWDIPRGPYYAMRDPILLAPANGSLEVGIASLLCTPRPRSPLFMFWQF